MNRKIFISVVLLVFAVTFSYAQVFSNARSVSLAGAYMTCADGGDALLWNPASLGFGDVKFGMSFGIVPFVPFDSFYLYNNSINASWFNKYLASGLYLDENLKGEMLSYFPSGGLNVMGEVCGKIVGIRIKNFAFAINQHVVFTGNLPKILFNLLFDGVRIGQEINLDGAGAFVQSYGSLDLGYGRMIKNGLINKYFDKFSFGLTLRLLVGEAVAMTEDVDGSLTLFKDGVSVDATSRIKGGAGGFGFGVGAGMMGKVKDRLTIGLSVNNLFSTIKWNMLTRGYELKYENFIKSEDFFGDDVDSLFEAGIVADSSMDIDAFRTALPSYLMVGLGYNFSKKLNVYANVVQFLSENWYSSVAPVFSLGLELRYLKIMPLRFGISMGGGYGFKWGAGFGLGGRLYSFDFGFSQDSGFFNKARGFTLSFSHEFRF